MMSFSIGDDLKVYQAGKCVQIHRNKGVVNHNCVSENVLFMKKLYEYMVEEEEEYRELTQIRRDKTHRIKLSRSEAKIIKERLEEEC